MFAFGRTIAFVESACNDKDSQQVVPAAILIARLTDSNHACRMRACEAVEHDFFAPAKESLKILTAECHLCLGEACPGDRECCRINANAGVVCSLAQHFVCASCIETIVMKAAQTSSDNDTANLSRLSDGKIHCPHCLAQQPRVLCDYADSQISRALPTSVFEKYLSVRLQLLEDRRTSELQAGMQQKIQQVCSSMCFFNHTYIDYPRSALIPILWFVYGFMYVEICILHRLLKFERLLKMDDHQGNIYAYMQPKKSYSSSELLGYL
jgi:hypothetical protein